MKFPKKEFFDKSMRTYTVISPTELTSAGEALKKELKHLGITQKAFAEMVGMSPSHLSEIIKGNRPITIKQAEKFEAFLSIPVAFWLDIQAKFHASQNVSNPADIEEKESSQLLSEYDDLISVKDLIRRLGITATSNQQKVAILQLDYDLPLPKELRQRIVSVGGMFRKSAKQGLDSRMIATWTILARKAARDVKVEGVFDRNDLRRLGMELQKIFHQNKSTIDRVTETLSAYGIKFCVVEKLEHASIDGFSFIENGIPAIVVTTRLNKIDNLAFAVLHEVCHTYKHLTGERQSNISLSIADYDNESKEEREANDFAGNTLIPQTMWEQAPSVPMNPYIIQLRYTEWAQRYGLNKWIVLGRVSHETGMYKFKADDGRLIH